MDLGPVHVRARVPQLMLSCLTQCTEFEFSEFNFESESRHLYTTVILYVCIIMKLERDASKPSLPSIDFIPRTRKGFFLGSNHIFINPC